MRGVGEEAKGGIGAIEDVESWLERVFAEAVDVDCWCSAERGVSGLGAGEELGSEGIFANDRGEVSVRPAVSIEEFKCCCGKVHYEVINEFAWWISIYL